MKVVKLIILQIFWYVSIKYGDQYFVPAIGIFLYLTDFLIFKKTEKLGSKYLIFSLILIFSGMGMDKLFEALEFLTWGDSFYPLELVGVWAIFPCYYYQFFKKFSSPIWLSFLMGAVFGPVAYYSGANINPSLLLQVSVTGICSLSVLWGLFFFSSIYFYSRSES